jgi:hypothetical protein
MLPPKVQMEPQALSPRLPGLLVRALPESSLELREVGARGEPGLEPEPLLLPNADARVKLRPLRRVLLPMKLQRREYRGLGHRPRFRLADES